MPRSPGACGLVLTRHDTIVWIVNHHVTGSEKESWRNTVEADEVLANIDKGAGPKPWATIFKQLVALTPPKTIVNFELFWRNPQPRWASPHARVVRIGDAAHSFLPASGNIPQSVRAHVLRLRFVRNACAQKLGFSNAELLQDTDWAKVRLDPRRAQPRLPSWVFSHDPEAYAYENYDKVVESMRRGVPFDQDDSIPPNHPPGYKYEEWNIQVEQIMEDIRNGKPVDLGPGDWR